MTLKRKTSTSSTYIPSDSLENVMKVFENLGKAMTEALVHFKKVGEAITSKIVEVLPFKVGDVVVSISQYVTGNPHGYKIRNLTITNFLLVENPINKEDPSLLICFDVGYSSMKDAKTPSERVNTESLTMNLKGVVSKFSQDLKIVVRR